MEEKMSYSFEMSFKEIKKEKLVDYMYENIGVCMDNFTEIIRANILYAPSLQIGNVFLPEDKKLYTKGWAEADKNWLYSLFMINFVYWEEKSLLGICGCIPNVLKNELVTIYFQNSTDQDYEYEQWKGLSCFQSDIEQIKKMGCHDLIEYYNKNGYHYIEDDLNDLDYHRKSLVYDRIFSSLDLDNWLYGRNGNYKRFAMNGITSQEILFKMLTILRKELIMNNVKL